jgi:hypothetical protein
VNRNGGNRHGRDEGDRTSLPEKAGTGLWPVRCGATSVSRLGMPEVGGVKRVVAAMGVQR